MHLLTSRKMYETFPAHLPVHRRTNVPPLMPYIARHNKVTRKPPLDDHNPVFEKKTRPWDMYSTRSGKSLGPLRKLKTRDKHWVT
jgi:hypothetical protein